MLFKLLKPLKEDKDLKEELEDFAITLKFPPIVSRFRNPSKEVIFPSLIIRLSVIVFKPYKPSKVVKVEHSNLSEPLISVSRLSNFCKVVISPPLTITFPLTLV